MRKIDPNSFGVARRGTAREVNRQILLALISAHEPVSRAELARLMNTNRANVTLIVKRMLAEGVITEGPPGAIARGRRPRLLQINARQGCVVAVDIRPIHTHLALTDMLGHQITDIETWSTERDPARFTSRLGRRIRALLTAHARHLDCLGVGVVVPGAVDETGRVVVAPYLGWHDVPLAAELASRLGLVVKVEHSGRACALAQVWMTRGKADRSNDLVYVSVSEGIGVGVVIKGELVRGRRDSAGQFGHIPLSIDGPRCSCGASGCWEAYASNLATLERYWGGGAVAANHTIPDLVERARAGDWRASAALLSTGRYLGLGLASIVSAIDPSRLYIGGEITAAWDLIGGTVLQALQERVFGDVVLADLIRVVSPADQPRLLGAAALIAAPAFAAPRVA